MAVSGHTGTVLLETSPTAKLEWEGDFVNFSITKRKVRYDVTTMAPTRVGRVYMSGLDESTVEFEVLIRDAFSYTFATGLQHATLKAEFYFNTVADKLAGLLFVTSLGIPVNVTEVLKAKIRGNFHNGLTTTF